MDMKENFENNMEIQFAALKDKTYFVFNDDLSFQILLPKTENEVIDGRMQGKKGRGNLRILRLDDKIN